MKKEEFISSGLLEQYALGITSPEENITVEEHLQLYPELRSDLDSIESSLESYAMLNAVTPPAQVKHRLMKELFGEEEVFDEEALSQSTKLQRSKRIQAFYRVAAAALLILLIGSVILTYNYYGKYRESQKQLAEVQQQMEQQQESNKALSNDLDIVTNKYSQPVVLKGTPHWRDAVAKIFWMKNTGQVFIDPSNLPAPPAGKQYQLWAIVDGKPVDAGLITTPSGTYSIQKMKSFGKVDAFAITLEKTGGSPTPTLEDMVVISEM